MAINQVESVVLRQAAAQDVEGLAAVARTLNHHFARLDAAALVLRWDSFRLWESFAAGCLTVHLDFDKYGFALPVRPEPWTHYVPIDLDDIAGSVTALMDRESEWAAIADAGWAWALEHYAPKPTALRVLSDMLAHKPAA